MKKLNRLSQVIIAVSALVMILSFYVPVWQILMWAPQYPEGLEMKIWLDTITGDYKIISGLNHYIGMKHIEISMFPEFGYMPYIVGGLVGFGIVTALVNRRAMLVAYVLLFLIAGVAGMVDFYMWGYDYGHNLDPHAPIVVPGMAYQPPLIGTKQLLNFTAFSAPDIGGYVFLVSGLLAIGTLVYELRAARKSMAKAAALLVAVGFFTACSASPEPLKYGQDACYHCKMTLMDEKFGSEVVTKKGKVFKFDDVNCLQSFLESGEVPAGEVQQTLIVDFAKPGTLIDAGTAWYVKADAIKTPMASNVAAFSSESDARHHNETWQGTVQTWSDLSE